MAEPIVALAVPERLLAPIEVEFRRSGLRARAYGDIGEAFDAVQDGTCALAVVTGEAALDWPDWPTAGGVVVLGDAPATAPAHVVRLPEEVPTLAVAQQARRLLDSAGSVVAEGADTPLPIAGEADPLPTVIGGSAALSRVLETIRDTARTRATLLLQGESGTGKEVLAHYAHALSERAKRPFVAVNCAALPDTLVESMLFGHEKGAFTGADRRFKGAFERANRGTILLDEISEMDVRMQAKLLRVLQEGTFERLGGEETVRVDVRVIATSNRDLAAEVDAGRFREDLYYRLAVLPILVPPLRERREDIRSLAVHFARSAGADMGRAVEGIAPRALEVLISHEWPGNVRELRHVVERAVALGKAPFLQPEDFMPERRGIAPWRVPSRRSALGPSLVHLSSYRLDEAEERLIAGALEAAGGNRTRAADLLGISVRTLRNKLNRPADETGAGEDGENAD